MMRTFAGALALFSVTGVTFFQTASARADEASVESASVALCLGPTPKECGYHCAGILLSRNVVITARHCALKIIKDTPCTGVIDSLDTVPAAQAWVSNAPSFPNVASYAQGIKWDFPRWQSACGHDVAVLRIDDGLPVRPERFPTPRFLPSKVSALEIFTYASEGASGLRRRTRVPSSVICLGGIDACSGPPEGNGLQPGELLIGNNVCKGDSGVPALEADRDLVGILTRASLGGSPNCGLGVATGFSSHALLMGRSVREALGSGQPEPSWVAAAFARGNSDLVKRGEPGMPCDRDDECSKGTCTSPDGGRTYQCSVACDGALCASGFECIRTSAGGGGDRCFTGVSGDVARVDDGGCSVGTVPSRYPSFAGILAFIPACCLWLRMRSRQRRTTRRVGRSKENSFR